LHYLINVFRWTVSYEIVDSGIVDFSLPLIYLIYVFACPAIGGTTGKRRGREVSQWRTGGGL